MGSREGLMQIPEKVERWPIERVREYERNSRTHSASQVDRIAASMMEFGFTSPLLVDADDVLVAGHGRLAAAQKLGLEEVPVIVLGHLTAEQRRAYVIADNQLALQAGWDEELLAQELDMLQASDFDLDLLGFDGDELTKLLGGEFEGEEEPEEEDEGINRGVALAIVLSPQELMTWRRAKAELGYSTDKAAFWKLVEDLLKEADS
jgi:ParB-like chromosome segregation protein Spo0J